MGRRRSYLPLVALLGAAVAVLPAVAISATETTVSAICASECSSLYAKYAWSPPQAEAAPGGSVTFQNMSATVAHGIVWKSVPATPVCEAGVPVYATFTGEGKPNWKGNCTFSQAGTYSFYCSVHGESMSGTITVGSSGTITTTTTAPTPTTTANTTPPPPPPSESPLVGSVGKALRVAKSQRGGSVKGSIDISKAGAGDGLDVELFASSASIGTAGHKHNGRTRVGRLVRGSVPAGVSSFSVKLDAKARRALKRRHRLALTVKVTLTPLYGEALTIARFVTEHA